MVGRCTVSGSAAVLQFFTSHHGFLGIDLNVSPFTLKQGRKQWGDEASKARGQTDIYMMRVALDGSLLQVVAMFVNAVVIA